MKEQLVGISQYSQEEEELGGDLIESREKGMLKQMALSLLSNVSALVQPSNSSKHVLLYSLHWIPTFSVTNIQV